MGKNAELFRECLKARDILLEERETKEEIIFAIENTIPSGPRVRIVIVFDNDDERVSIFSFNYVTVDNALKREIFLEKINELNMLYVFNKFVMNEKNEISANVAVFIDNNFSGDVIWDLAIMLYHALEEEYKGFMQLLWS